ncbi:hypothetical protein [Pseudofrankia asymbiotica]|uniref:Uncharacterized protein n=1 Tax=Pseudofrankia asymbiotica TaxID=1834516 RepID=A0A1V2I207_9ACTN|nr:hypothetical protein [Pseudofrankia asymbiotica]ONH23318.1 hypothetical protein BL253_33385 [Pseudofrankia asymbiotica]
MTKDGAFYEGPGVHSKDVPATLSRVVFHVNDRVDGDNRAVALHAGLVGVTQEDGGALRPVAGWHLTPAAIEIDDVIDRIMRDHAITPPRDVDWWREAAVCAEILALYRRIGSATLLDGAWRILPFADHRTVWFGDHMLSIVVFIELDDGRSIGAVHDFDFDTRTTHWVACRVEDVTDPGPDLGRRRFRLADEPSEVSVYGTSLALLLDAALHAGGDIAHLETGRLDQLDQPAA